jgi:hypothetical protein
LSLLFTLEAQREQVLAESGFCLRQGNWQRALALIDGADALRRGPDAQHLRALVYLLQRRFSGAWQTYATARGQAPAD